MTLATYHALDAERRTWIVACDALVTLFDRAGWPEMALYCLDLRIYLEDVKVTALAADAPRLRHVLGWASELIETEGGVH